MSTQHNEIREGRPDDINPNEIGENHPAKDRKAQEKPEIKESGLGRESTQTPADEHIEHRLSQIDADTKQLHQNESDKNSGESQKGQSDSSEERNRAN